MVFMYQGQLQANNRLSQISMVPFRGLEQRHLEVAHMDGTFFIY